MPRKTTDAATALLQPFPALDDATEAALRASIQRFGVLVPVVHDQHGRILDGHHRSRIADALGVSYRIDVREIADDGEAKEIARTLNADRRHLTAAQRRPIVAALREEGHSFRAIGGALGVSAKTAFKDHHESPVTPVTPERVEGQDGKSYPSTRPKPEPQPERRGYRKNRDAPFELASERARLVAQANRQRVADGLAQINGICRGLRDVDYGMVAAVATPEDIASFKARAEELSRALREIKSKLTEVHHAR